MADAKIVPVIDNQTVGSVVSDWWREMRMPQTLRRLLKEFLLTGEVWNYVPRLNKRRGIRVRPLVPWNIVQVVGYSAQEWETAQYNEVNTGEIYTLKPENTSFTAHDALFDSLRGTPPFAALFFAVQTYEDWLQGRVRINRLAGNVVGRMRFPDAYSAAASIPNARVIEDGDVSTLEVNGPVELPPSGSVAVLIGEDADFQLLTPNVGAYMARDDGEFMWRAVVESTRLPEFLSGWARGVNVATARVQYPFAVRMMLALRDEFDDAMQETIRLVLQRMVEHKLIPPTWKDSKGRTVNPRTAQVSFTWPEVRELDFDTISQTVLGLLQLGVIDQNQAFNLLGWNIEGAQDGTGQKATASVDIDLWERFSKEMEATLDAWLEKKLDEGANTPWDGGGEAPEGA